ncbi:tol-pal system protein YbgF [Desulfobacterota bacterium AH_259_B03_O07]|nr:tol-pal system protein YbgF [Desulfobacterota bacterium AH_259_B03_O07]
MYLRQNRLEAKTEKLSEEVEALKRKPIGSNNENILDQLVYLEKKINDMERANAELESRFNEITRTGDYSSQLENFITDDRTSSSQSAGPIFNEGYRNLSEGKYKKAREQFLSFLDTNPTSPEASDAIYWIAESYYREGKFEQSILEFQRFIDTYPKDSRVPLAYLKQGLSLVNIGRKEEAKLFLQTLIDKYPKSDEAKIAKEKLNELAV